jgi:hypothetical protein
MATLTSGGAVNLTASTNWSPAQIPVAGDALIVATGHILTLNDSMALLSVTMQGTGRLASGGSFTVEATNGWTFPSNSLPAGGQVVVMTSGHALVLQGEWSGYFNSGSSCISNVGSGASLTLEPIGGNTALSLWAEGLTIGIIRQLTNGMAGGTLITKGKFPWANLAYASIVVTISGGSWTHTATALSEFGAGAHRIVAATGTATVNWTGSISSQSSISANGVFTLSSSSTSHTIGQTGDTLCLRNASTTNLSALISITSGKVTIVGMLSARAGGYCIYVTGGVVDYINQTLTLPSTDYLTTFMVGGTLNVSGLQVTSDKGFMFHCYASAIVTVDSNTLFTCSSTAAFFGCYYNTGLESKFVILESDPPTLPSVSDVAAGEVYGYSASLLTGTGIINDPAAIAAAMITSFGSLPEVLVKTTIATLASQTSFTLTAGSADNDAYNGQTVIVTDASTSAQKAVGVVLDYVGSTKTVTLSADPAIFTMAVGDSVCVIAGASSGGGGGDTAGVTELLTRIPDATPGAEGGLPVLSAGLTVTAVLDSATETKINKIEAAVAGTVTGAGTSTEVFAGPSATLTITVDSSGNRSAVVVT